MWGMQRGWKKKTYRTDPVSFGDLLRGRKEKNTNSFFCLYTPIGQGIGFVFFVKNFYLTPSQYDGPIMVIGW